MKPTALVTGATGAIGSALIQHLFEHGYQVRALVRSTSLSGRLPESVETVWGDITNCHVLGAAVAATDVVFHLAAKLHTNDPPPSLQSEYHRVNVEGTRCLVEAAQAAGVKRLVFFSTINVYGPTRRGEVMNEDSPLHPDSWYAETKAQGEQIVLTGLPAVVLRLAAVYGPSMKGNYLRLLNAIRRERFAIIGDGCNRRTLVHVNDVCTAALTAAEHPAAVGQTYNVTDGHVHTLQEIIDAISAALEQSPPRCHLPARPARVLASVLEDGLRLLGKKPPIGRSTVDKFVEDIAVSGTKIQRELGYLPLYDLSVGWQETIGQ